MAFFKIMIIFFTLTAQRIPLLESSIIIDIEKAAGQAQKSGL